MIGWFKKTPGRKSLEPPRLDSLRKRAVNPKISATNLDDDAVSNRRKVLASVIAASAALPVAAAMPTEPQGPTTAELLEMIKKLQEDQTTPFNSAPYDNTYAATCNAFTMASCSTAGPLWTSDRFTGQKTFKGE